MAGNRWVITQNSETDYDVTKNGRAFGYGYDDMDEARRAVKKSRFFKPGDIITYTSSEGDRSKVK
jgi:hypothetical protein